MHAPRRVSPAEASLWRAVTRGVRRLEASPPPVDKVPPPPEPLPATSTVPPAAAAADLTIPATVRAATLPGLDRRREERLHKGELPIDGRLDLHGMTQDMAHSALRQFVRAALARGDRCLLVITGKGGLGGGGVLRREVPRWLESLGPLLLRVVPAQPRHGGDGAYYVFLKRRR